MRQCPAVVALGRRHQLERVDAAHDGVIFYTFNSISIYVMLLKCKEL